MMNYLSNKRAFVLGGSRGIGAAVVKRLAELGANVHFTYLAATDAARAVADRTGSTAIQADSVDRAAVIAAVAAAGPIDILVANAGVAALSDPLATDPDAVDRMIDINVRASYHASVEAARTMPDAGRIILIGSVNGDRMQFQGGAAYAMTKSALQGMARGFARDFGPRGITVNVVQPGPVDTDLNPGDGPFAPHMHALMAIPRHVRVEEVAELVAYLAGPHAAMITGAMHTIDGGMSA